MKFKCDEKKLKKINKLLEYYKKVEKGYEEDWFAWFPVRIGLNDCRWLETVTIKRKLDSHGVDAFKTAEHYLKRGWTDMALYKLEHGMYYYTDQEIVAKS